MYSIEVFIPSDESVEMSIAAVLHAQTMRQVRGKCRNTEPIPSHRANRPNFCWPMVVNLYRVL